MPCESYLSSKVITIPPFACVSPGCNNCDRQRFHVFIENNLIWNKSKLLIRIVIMETAIWITAQSHEFGNSLVTSFVGEHLALATKAFKCMLTKKCECFPRQKAFYYDPYRPTWFLHAIRFLSAKPHEVGSKTCIISLVDFIRNVWIKM